MIGVAVFTMAGVRIFLAARGGANGWSLALAPLSLVGLRAPIGFFVGAVLAWEMESLVAGLLFGLGRTLVTGLMSAVVARRRGTCFRRRPGVS